MPCKDITWRTCYVRCSNLTVNTTSFSFFWVLFYTWLSKIKIFFGGGRALKVRKLDFHRRIVFISRPCLFLNGSHPTEKDDVLVYLCAYTFIDTIKERLFHHRFLDPLYMEHKIYKCHDLREYFDQFWYLIWLNYLV